MLTAWIGAILIGLSLGLLGSGGSILTVPILVYLVKHPEKQAIAESLVVVGAIALFSAARAAHKGQVCWRAVAWFGVPGIGGSLLGAHLAKHVPGEVQLALLACLMLIAAVRMVASAKEQAAVDPPRRAAPPPVLIAIGFALGLITGLVGVGGGFLIVPALVLLAGVEMRQAVGTSLALIVVNSAVGFVKYQHTLDTLGMRVDWRTIAVFSLLGMLGSMIGSSIGRRIDQRILRRVFAMFLVLMAGYILWHQLTRP